MTEEPMVTVPADLRVEIRDARVADGITPAGMQVYLAARGWQVAARRRSDGAEQWAAEGVKLRAVVPPDLDDPEYGLEVLTAVWRIAAAEGRGQLEVVADLRAASQEGDGNGR